MYSFLNLESVCCSMSSSKCCFLTYIQISQEAGKAIWSSHLYKFSTFGCDRVSNEIWCLRMKLFKTQEKCLKVTHFYFSDQGCVLSQTAYAHKRIYECIFRSKVDCLASDCMHHIWISLQSQVLFKWILTLFFNTTIVNLSKNTLSFFTQTFQGKCAWLVISKSP